MVKLIGADTETIIKNSVHEFYSFQLYSNDITIHHKPIHAFCTEPYELTKYLTDKTENAWFVTFNLSFDAVVIAKALKGLNYSISCCFAGSRITRMTIRKNGRKWVFCDLHNIFPNTNLAKIGEVIGLQKMEKPEYLGKRAPQNTDETAYFIQYAMRDAEICYKMSRLIYQEFNTFRTTCASLAMRVFKRDFCHIRKFHNYPTLINIKFRMAYHGGRTECFIRGTNPVPLKCYDVNSLYPYVMQERDYPNVLENFVKGTTCDFNKHGLTNARVHVDADFPPIAVKRMCTDGIEKLMFTNGTYEAWFTNAELSELESTNSGYVISVKESYQWKNSFNPFKDFISTFYTKKQRASIAQSPTRELYKIMLNSTYGKFGEHGRCTFIDLDGAEIVKQRTAKPRFAWYHSVPIAAYITAYARLYLSHILRALNPEKVYYCDTDCIWTSEDLSSKCSNDLGALKIEESTPSNAACFIRAKFYLSNDNVTMKGFEIKDSAAKIKLAIFTQNFKRYEHRITKLLESQRIHKPALYDYDIVKRFSIEEDCKRKFDKTLNNESLLFDYSKSLPLEVIM